MTSVYDWPTARAAFATAKNKETGKPLANNTRLVATGEMHGRQHDYAIKLHDTNVVTYHPDNSVTLNTGGWRTVTTKDRINEFQALGNVWSERGTWNFYTAGALTKIAPFADGMRIYPDGRITGAGKPDTAKTEKVLRKRVTEYANEYVTRLLDGRIEAPSGGDCWYCVMTVTDGPDMGKGIGETFHDSSHVLSHLGGTEDQPEPYYVPSLILRAAKAMGASLVVQDVITASFDRESINALNVLSSDWYMTVARRDLPRMLRRYMLRELGLSH